MDVTLEKIKSMVDSNTIIGNPINMADGTLVPVSYTHLDVYKRQVWRSSAAPT